MVIEKVFGLSATGVSLSDRFRLLGARRARGTTAVRARRLRGGVASPRLLNQSLVEALSRRNEIHAAIAVRQRALRQRIGVFRGRGGGGGALRRWGSESSVFAAAPVRRSNSVSSQRGRFKREGSYSNLSRSGSYGNLNRAGSYGNLSRSGSYRNLNRAGSYGNLSRSGSYGNLNRAGSYGNLSRSGSYGNLNRAGSYGNLSRSGSYGHLNRTGSYGNLNRAGSYGNLNQAGYGNLRRLGSSGNLSRGGRGRAVGRAQGVRGSFVPRGAVRGRVLKSARGTGAGRGGVQGRGRGGVQGRGRGGVQGRGRGSGARGRGARGRGGARGGGGGVLPSREELDEQLDQYMASTKTALDRELDIYMKEV